MSASGDRDFEVSELVWAKMRGYPQWPARIVPKPRGQPPPSANHYFIFFYGSHDVAWIPSKDLLPFKKYQEKFRQNSQRHRLLLSEAIWEAEEDPELTLSDAREILTRLEKFGRKKRKRNTNGREVVKERKHNDNSANGSNVASKNMSSQENESSPSKSITRVYNTRRRSQRNEAKCENTINQQDTECPSTDNRTTDVSTSSNASTLSSLSITSIQNEEVHEASTKLLDELHTNNTDDVKSLMNDSLTTNHSINNGSEYSEIPDTISSPNYPTESLLITAEPASHTATDLLITYSSNPFTKASTTSTKNEPANISNDPISSAASNKPGNTSFASNDPTSISEPDNTSSASNDSTSSAEPASISSASNEPDNTSSTSNDPTSIAVSTNTSNDPTSIAAFNEPASISSTSNDPTSIAVSTNTSNDPTSIATFNEPASISSASNDPTSAEPSSASNEPDNTSSASNGPTSSAASNEPNNTSSASNGLTSSAASNEPANTSSPSNDPTSLAEPASISSASNESDNSASNDPNSSVASNKSANTSNDTTSSEPTSISSAVYEPDNTSSLSNDPTLSAKPASISFASNEPDNTSSPSNDLTSLAEPASISSSSNEPDNSVSNDPTSAASNEPANTSNDTTSSEPTSIPSSTNKTLPASNEPANTSSISNEPDNASPASNSILTEPSSFSASNETCNLTETFVVLTASQPVNVSIIEPAAVISHEAKPVNDFQNSNFCIVDSDKGTWCATVKNEAMELCNSSTSSPKGSGTSINEICDLNTVDGADSSISNQETYNYEESKHSNSIEVPVLATSNGNESQATTNDKLVSIQTSLKPITESPAPPLMATKDHSTKVPSQKPVLSTMSVADMLRVYNYNLKVSLIATAVEPQQAIKVLRNLLDLPFTASDITDVKDIVYTLRKVRKYKGNVKVRNKANEVYSKIKSLYVNGETKNKGKKFKKQCQNTSGEEQSKALPNPRKRKVTDIDNDNEGVSSKSLLPPKSCKKKTTINDEPTESEVNYRRSQRTALRGRVNYTELSGEGSVEDEQTVPEL